MKINNRNQTANITPSDCLIVVSHKIIDLKHILADLDRKSKIYFRYLNQMIYLRGVYSDLHAGTFPAGFDLFWDLI